MIKVVEISQIELIASLILGTGLLAP